MSLQNADKDLHSDCHSSADLQKVWDGGSWGAGEELLAPDKYKIMR